MPQSNQTHRQGHALVELCIALVALAVVVALGWVTYDNIKQQQTAEAQRGLDSEPLEQELAEFAAEHAPELQNLIEELAKEIPERTERIDALQAELLRLNLDPLSDRDVVRWRDGLEKLQQQFEMLKTERKVAFLNAKKAGETVMRSQVAAERLQESKDAIAAVSALRKSAADIRMEVESDTKQTDAMVRFLQAGQVTDMSKKSAGAY